MKTTLNELYEQKKQLRVHLSDKPFVFSVILIGRDNTPDCNISSWGANLYFRTLYGQTRKQYKSIRGIKRAVTNVVKQYVDTKGKISFSISDEIDII